MAANITSATSGRAMKMLVAVSLGGDPVYPYMATALLLPATDECLFGRFSSAASRSSW